MAGFTGTVRARAGIAGALGLLLLALSHSIAGESGHVLDAWFAAQTNFHTFTGKVIQTRTLQALSQPLVSTGQVWIAIPNRFRWEIGQPAQTIALRQPDALSLVYPRLKRLEKYPLNASQPGPWRDMLALLDASFPRSRAELETQFRVLSVSPTNADWVVTLEPKSALARRMMAGIEVSFRTNDFLLTATEMRFADGSRMRNDFIQARTNVVLPDGCFDLKLSPDYKVVEPLQR